MKSSYKIVTTTVAGDREAEDLATLLTELKLVACVQFWPIRSVYRWKGQIESGREHLLTCKTTAHLVPALVAFIRQHHSYEVPEILVTPIDKGHPDYLAWITRETAQPRLTFRDSATRKRGSRKNLKA